MIRDVRTLSPYDHLDAALRHVLDGFQQDFPVVENGQVVGVLTRDALLKALAQHGRDALVASAMERTFLTAQPQDPAEQAVAKLRECRCRTVPVVSGGQLRGVLTLDNVGEYVMIEAALRSAASHHAA